MARNAFARTWRHSPHAPSPYAHHPKRQPSPPHLHPHARIVLFLRGGHAGKHGFSGHETAFWHGFRPCSGRKRCCGRQNPRSENLKASKMRRNRPSVCQNAVSWPKSEGFATWKPVPLRRQNENAHRCTGESTKRENGDVENASGWAARIRTLIAGTKNQSPAVGRRPSEQIEAHNDERKWWAVRESNPRPWD